MTRVAYAIKLREWTRIACDNEDDEAILRLSKMADRAYLALTRRECAVYIEWACGPYPSLAARVNAEIAGRLTR